MPITILFLPAADIAQYVGEGNVDLGITGEIQGGGGECYGSAEYAKDDTDLAGGRQKQYVGEGNVDLGITGETAREC
jgi:hypothetical protein